MIVIPSRGRAKKQTTAEFFPECIIHVPLEEWSEYRAANPRRCIYGGLVNGIAPVRDNIVERAHIMRENKLIMMDDDIDFFWAGDHRGGDPTQRSLYQCQSYDLACMIDAVYATLDDYPFVGIAMREGHNRLPPGIVENVRICRVLAIRTDVMRMHGIKFSDVRIMEDFHVCLSLLKLGYKTATLTDWAQNQGHGSGAEGGCSAYRTAQTHEEESNKLAEMHAPFVKVVKKTTKGAWKDFDGERTDVTVYWKKAYAAGVAKHGARKPPPLH